jgi:hypothetical protein
MMTGGCLCGAVRYEVAADPVYTGHCHCRSCQRSSGAGHSTYVGVPRAAMTVHGETRSYAATGGSGLQAWRHFCPVCGSQLFGIAEMDPGTATLYAGTLDDPSVIQPDAAINVRDRQPWDHVEGHLPEFDGMPPGASGA